MKVPPYALTHAPQGAALADRQSRIRCALDRAAYFHASHLAHSDLEN